MRSNRCQEFGPSNRFAGPASREVPGRELLTDGQFMFPLWEMLSSFQRCWRLLISGRESAPALCHWLLSCAQCPLWLFLSGRGGSSPGSRENELISFHPPSLVVLMGSHLRQDFLIKPKKKKNERLGNSTNLSHLIFRLFNRKRQNQWSLKSKLVYLVVIFIFRALLTFYMKKENSML